MEFTNPIIPEKVAKPEAQVTKEFLASLPRTIAEYCDYCNQLEKLVPEDVAAYDSLRAALLTIGLKDMSDSSRDYAEAVYRNGRVGWQQELSYTQECLDRIHVSHSAVIEGVANTGRFIQPAVEIDWGRSDY